MAASSARVGLGILFAVSMLVEVRFTVDSIDQNLHVTQLAREPFALKTPEGTLEPPLLREARAAQFKPGDRLLTLDGQPAGGRAPIARIANAHRPGDVVDATVERDGARYSAPVKLAPQRDKPLSAGDWTLAIFLFFLTPWFCIVLGFAVAFLRPTDPLAWLLLLLMLSFGEVAQGNSLVAVAGGWDAPSRTLAVVFQSILNGTWPVWMLLFGQYFPGRQARQRWHRVTRWLLAYPLLLTSVVNAAAATVVVEDAGALAGVQRLLLRVATPIIIAAMVAISTFFVNLSRKMVSASIDERRRMRLLYAGTTVSLTPLFILVIVSVVLRRNISSNDWFVVPALLALFLFPTTMAYVIVVEKAMDLKVAIRQGLQYALARRGLRVLTILCGIGVFVTAMALVNDPGRSNAQKMGVIAVLVIVMVRMRIMAERLRNWLDRRFFREAVNTEGVLRELGEKVRTIVEVQPLLVTVTSTIAAALHVPRIAVMTRQNGYYTPAHALGYATLAPELKFSATSALATRLEQSREPLRVSRKRPEPWLDKNVEALGTELLLPMAVKDRLLGFLSLGPKLSEEPYTPTDVALLESVASQTGMALENSRLTEAMASEVAQRERLNRELEIAREVQQRLFPQAGPEVAGLDYAGKCRPASSVGGDYYDFVSMCDGRLGIAIGDISGKGVPAALLMASLQASLRGLAIANPPALSALMVNLNRLIYEASPSNRYATFFYGVYDPLSREFRYVNGGHNPPMVFRGGDVLRLEEGGPVVGLFGPAQYTQGSIALARGDTLLLYTDGVSEAMNNAEEEFDEERLIAAVRAAAQLTAPEVIDRVMEACDAFAEGAPQHDDMTLVVVRVL